MQKRTQRGVNYSTLLGAVNYVAAEDDVPLVTIRGKSYRQINTGRLKEVLTNLGFETGDEFKSSLTRFFREGGVIRDKHKPGVFFYQVSDPAL